MFSLFSHWFERVAEHFKIHIHFLYFRLSSAKTAPTKIRSLVLLILNTLLFSFELLTLVKVTNDFP